MAYWLVLKSVHAATEHISPYT